MRTVSMGLGNHCQGALTTLSLGWFIKRPDGTIKRYTNSDRPRTLSASGSPVNGVYVPGPMESDNAIQVKLDMSVNNMTMNGFFIDNDISEADAVARLYQSSEVYTFYYNWKNTSQGIGKLIRGTLGDVKRQGIGFSAEFRSLGQALQFNLCSITSTGCRSAFGSTGIGPSAGCRIPVEAPLWTANTDFVVQVADSNNPGGEAEIVPTVENGWQYRCIDTGTSGGSEPTWDTTLGGTTSDGSVTWETRRATKRTATVTAVTDTRTFTVGSILGDLADGTGGSASGGFFAEGTARGIDNANAGFEKRIRNFTDIGGGSFTVQLKDALPYLPTIGDTFFLLAGCDKAYETCHVNWANWKNFRGEHLMPGPDVLFKVSSMNGTKK